MAVNELEKEYLGLLHYVDVITSVIANMKMRESQDHEKKEQVGAMVQYLEMTILDDKFETAGKDLTPINDAIAAGRTYWRS